MERRSWKFLKAAGALLVLSLVFLLYVPTFASGRSGPLDTADEIALTAESEEFELLGHRVGLTSEVVVSGSYAYLGAGAEFVIVDITDPQQPVRRGTLLLDREIEDVELAGDHAFVAAGTQGLLTLDISQPDAPRQVGSYVQAEEAGEIVPAGNRLLLVDKTKVHILDITSPRAPEQVGLYVYEGQEEIRAVAASENHMFISHRVRRADNTELDTLHVVDISNPAELTVVSTLTSASENFQYFGKMEYRAGHLYILEIVTAVASRYGGHSHVILSIVDVTDAAKPERINSYSLPTVFFPVPPKTLDLAILGNHLFVIAESYLDSLEISDPANATHLGTLELHTWGRALDTNGGRLYVAGGSRGLHIFDPSTPANLKPIATYGEGVGHLREMEASRNRIITLSAKDNSGITKDVRILDGSAPGTPLILSRLYNARAVDVAVKEDRLYLLRSTLWMIPSAGVCDYDTDHLAIFDITHSQQPDPMGEYTIEPESSYHHADPYCRTDNSVVFASNHAYVSSDLNGKIYIFDVSDPRAPKMVATLDGPFKSLTVAGEYLYASNQLTTRIFDVSNPRVPTQVAEIAREARLIRVVGDQAYLASGSGLFLFDVTDPAQPQALGSYTAPEEIVDLALAPGRAYLVTERGLSILDTTDETQPMELHSYPVAGKATSVALDGGRIYLGTETNGLFVLRYGHALAGRVVDAYGAAVAGATLVASPTLSTTSGSDGSYAFASLPAGTYTVTASLSGYAFQPASRRVTLGQDSLSLDFTLLPEPVSLVLEPGTPATLTYTDTRGLPISLHFPAESVTVTTTLSLTPTVVDRRAGFTFTGHAFELRASRAGEPLPDLTFGAPITLSVELQPADSQLLAEGEELALWQASDGEWSLAEESCQSERRAVAVASSTISEGRLCATGHYALFGPTHEIFLPLTSQRGMERSQ